MNSSFNTLSNVSLTIFQASNKPKGDQRNVTYDQFVELLTPQSGEKDGSGFSPATFKHNHRGRENLFSIEMIVLDVEENKKTGEIPPDPKEVVERLIDCGFHGVVYTTYNHAPDAPRYRVVLFLSKPMIFSHEHNLRLFEHEVAREVTLKVANELGLSDLIDTSKLGGESLFFFPRYPSIVGEHARLFLSPGEPLNTSDLWRECQKKVAVLKSQNARQKEPYIFDQRAFRTQDLIKKLGRISHRCNKCFQDTVILTVKPQIAIFIQARLQSFLVLSFSLGTTEFNATIPSMHLIHYAVSGRSLGPKRMTS